MSRSNPTTNNPNPCTRWIEWDGSNGGFRHYDKDAKKNILIPDGFTFILLDQLATVKGWHDASDSGIFSNEVRDTKQEVMIVKAFKGGTIAEGFYAKIRDRINAAGGNYTTNLYVAFKTGDTLSIGSVQFKGAALSAWLEFAKNNRSDLYKKAIRVKGFTEGKKGKIVFRTPNFFLADITPETDALAIDCDKKLQAFLDGYFKRTRVEQVEQSPNEPEHYEHEPPVERQRPPHDPDLDPEPDPALEDPEDDIPF